jgi:hypothetical protein
MQPINSTDFIDSIVVNEDIIGFFLYNITFITFLIWIFLYFFYFKPRFLGKNHLFKYEAKKTSLIEDYIDWRLHRWQDFIVIMLLIISFPAFVIVSLLPFKREKKKPKTVYVYSSKRKSRFRRRRE